MPIITSGRFDQMVDQYYNRTDDEFHRPLYEFLNSSGLKKHLEGFLNKMLMSIATSAIQNSVKGRTMSVSFSINMVKAGQKFHSQLPREVQQSTPVDLIVGAMELLLEEQDFLVENHTLKYERHILLAEEIPETTAQPVTPPSPPAPLPEPEMPPMAIEEGEDDDDEDEDEDEDDAEDLDDEGAEIEAASEGNGVGPGMVFGNGRGIHRRVDNVAEGRVSYTVLQGGGNIKAGSEGETSYKAFLSWSKERISA